MLAQAGFHALTANAEAIAHLTSQSVMQRLAPNGPTVCFRRILHKHNYVQPSLTLEGRLGLGKEQVLRACQERDSVLRMVEREKEAVAKERLDKFRADVGLYLRNELEGAAGESADFLLGPTEPTRNRNLEAAFATVKALSEAGIVASREDAEARLRQLDWGARSRLECTFRKFGPTLDRIISLNDPHSGPRYVSAMSIPQVETAAKRAVWAFKELGPADREATGGSSAHAYEWCTQLVGGVMDGPTGPWRADLDHPKPSDWPLGPGDGVRRSEQPIDVAYIIAAMQVFDMLGRSSWTLTHDVRRVANARGVGPTDVVFWNIASSSTGLCIDGEVLSQYRSSDVKQELHKMMLSAFDNCAPDEPWHLLHRGTCPPKHSDDFVALGDKQRSRLLSQLVEYYDRVAQLGNAFPQVQFACLMVIGISPQTIVEALEANHRAWASGQLYDRAPSAPCPQTPRDFLAWLTNKPYASNGSAEPAHGAPGARRPSRAVPGAPGGKKRAQDAPDMRCPGCKVELTLQQLRDAGVDPFDGDGEIGCPQCGRSMNWLL
jgi:hypothetical protein